MTLVIGALFVGVALAATAHRRLGGWQWVTGMGIALALIVALGEGLLGRSGTLFFSPGILLAIAALVAANWSQKPRGT